MVTDTISDLLTRIRNAIMAQHQIVKIPYTKIAIAILTIFQEEGFIKDFETYEQNKKYYLLVSLKYKKTNPKQSVINEIKRVSKPGLRIYKNSKNLPIITSHLGFAIISTSKGLMTNKNAKNLGIGGEVLCYIW